jgi:hypothetical protein
VEGCQYLGDFVFENYASRGSPYWWADSQVLLLAAAKGATDVVFDTKSRAYFVGKGYRCS